MEQRSTVDRWRRVESLFDAAITLPTDARATFLYSQSLDDPSIAREVQALLDQLGTRMDLLDQAAHGLVQTHLGVTLAPGTRVGAYRVLDLVGRGGMGEVYRGERADGQFQNQVALKLIRSEAVDQLDRFHEERRLLARLDHPGIARLFDGGVADDGRPYMVIEWVEGLSLTDWCHARDASLERRLEVFLQVCEAVGYAHRNLVVHRDLKPGNILVNAEGRVKLLDFGVAKLLSPGAEQAQLTAAPLTPAYAAPEQLSGGAITTATDVYALGLILFELLTGARPFFHRANLSFVELIERQTHLSPPSMSTAKRDADAPSIQPKRLRGDLDAIVAKALRKEPEHRYESVAGLQADLQRHLHHEPVIARRGARGYVLSRFLLRYRWAVAGVVVLILTLALGLSGTLLQKRRAQEQARRAETVQAFLVDVFRASDPRIAQDKPRGQITAKELLDINASRIATQFKDSPETRIQLLGVVASIYRELGDEDRYRSYHDQQVELVRRLHGDAHPAIIAGLLDDARDANDRNDYAGALALLERVDPLIREAGLDRTAVRATWWLRRSAALELEAETDREGESLEQAVALFEQFAPTDPGYIEALTNLGWRTRNQDLELAAQHFEKAIAVANDIPNRNDALLQQLTYYGLAGVRRDQGRLDNAEQAFLRSAELARMTYGESHSSTWVPAAEYAEFLHLQGKTAAAHARFDRLMRAIPAGWTRDSYDEYAREFYALSLISEGRSAEAIPLLEHALRTYIEHPSVAYEQRRNRLILGDAYDHVGRHDEARAAIKASLDERIAKEPPDARTLLAARERWGRFLLTRGELTGAQEQFDAVVAAAPPSGSIPLFLTQLDLARLVLLRGDSAAALAFVAQATKTLETVPDANIRSGSMLWIVHSQALRQTGDPRAALEWATLALELRQKTDDPKAPAIAEAQIAIAHSALDLGDLVTARRWANEARAIHAAHATLADYYRESLRQLQARLS